MTKIFPSSDATTQLQDDSQQQLDDDEPMNDEPEEPRYNCTLIQVSLIRL